MQALTDPVHAVEVFDLSYREVEDILYRYCELRQGSPAIVDLTRSPDSSTWKGDPADRIWCATIACLINRCPERRVIERWCDLVTAEAELKTRRNSVRRVDELDALGWELKRVRRVQERIEGSRNWNRAAWSLCRILTDSRLTEQAA